MTTRGELLRALVIGIVVGAAVTIAVYELRGGPRTAPASRTVPANATRDAPRDGGVR